ncbi:uncharacterized protein LOC124140594 [Haliotis rufescens]|uniref:uncharacterized protein LOC124140594 n=1 Tax=Haliotis rufescens TaxID=6454 RepID=UPI00201F8B0F|nr:uncharacterized protein LOC124140594 [Haliotis rufescens]
MRAIEAACAVLLCSCVDSVSANFWAWKVEMIDGFENKRVTDHIMWTEPNTESLLECAVRCSQHDLAVTCGYNPNTLECVAYSARFTDQSTVAYVDNSKYRMYSLNPVPSVPPLGICNTSNDCLVADTECIEEECVCIISQVFSYAAGGCVQGCSQYSNTFTKFAGRVIYKHDDLFLTTATEDECRAACVTETSIVCKTLEYSSVSSACVLSSFGWMDVNVLYRGTNNNYDIHLRHCDF